MNRRDFLLKASAAAGGTAAASGAAAAQQGNTTGNQTGGNATGGGNQTGGNATGNATGGNQTGNQTGGVGGKLNFSGGGNATVNVGPGGNYVYAPGTEKPLYITPGTKVKFVWKSDGHNIVVESQPDGANWSGHEPLEDAGFTSTHTFKTMGKYHYYCAPHQSLGMVADIVVNSSGQAPGGGGEEEVDPEEMGVPLQAHYVGAATILMMVVSLIYTFFLVKYGESPNAKGGN